MRYISLMVLLSALAVFCAGCPEMEPAPPPVRRTEAAQPAPPPPVRQRVTTTQPLPGGYGYIHRYELGGGPLAPTAAPAPASTAAPVSPAPAAAPAAGTNVRK